MNLKTFPASGISRATLLVTSLGLAVVGQAADQTWINTNTNNDWNTGAGTNWDAGVAWTQGNSAIFGGTGETVTLTEAISAGNLTFSADSYIISGSTLTLSGVVDTGANTARIDSVLGGTAITKTGAGTLVLGATNFGGAMTVSQGRVEINNNASLGANGSLIIGNASSGATAPNVYFNNATPSFTSVTVGSGVADAAIYTNSWAQNVTGDTTLNAALTIHRMPGNTHGGFKHTGKITGPGAGSGNDTLILDYTGGSGNFYVESDGTVANDYAGNVRVLGGTNINMQGFGGGGDDNTFFPDSAMVTIEGASTNLRWNNFDTSVVETIDGLAGNGSMSRNLPTYTLTINANNGDNEGDRVFSGNIAGMDGVLTLGGTGTQEFSGTSPNFSNATNLNNGTLKLSKTTGWNSNIAFGTSNTPKLQLNAPAAVDVWAFGKQLTGGSTGAVIEKVGPGTVNLSPAAGSSFAGSATGAIAVSEGKLYLTNSNFTTAPAATVAGGATFGGSGTSGNITVANGGTLDANPSGAGTFTAANVTLGSTASATVNLKGSLSASTPALTVSNLTINGGNQKLEIATSGTGLVNGTTYDLVVSANPITAPNASSVLASLKSNSRSQSLVVNPGGTKIQLYYDANATIYWTGAASDDWTTASANFKLSGNNSNTLFLANDVVFFHDNPTNSTVDIASADVTPAAVTFDNTTATEYTVESSGSFGITTGSITKSNNGTVILTNSNSTGGTVTLNGGNMFLWNSDSLGTGPLNFDGGQLTYDGLDADWTRSISIGASGGTVAATASAGVLTHIGPLSGAGTLNKVDEGTFALGGANGSFGGSVNIVGGTLALSSNASLGTANAITLGNAGSTNPTLLINASGMALGAVTVPAGVTNAAVSFSQNSGTFSHTINGATLGSALMISQSGANFPNWDQVTWASKITGSGGGSGNDTLVFSNTSGMQNYFTTNAGVTHDFAGNVRVTSGVVAVQSGAPASNHIVPDSSLLNVEAGEWRWNTGGVVETIDGLAGAGALGNPGNSTLTINASNPDNNGDRVFAGALGTMAGELIKSGPGTQTFSGTGINYGSATRIDAGTLELNGTTSFASSAVTVNGGKLLVNNATGTGTGTTATITVKTGAALAGTGSVGGTTTIEAGGTVAPGDGAAGTLAANAASLAGTYQCQLDGVAGDSLTVSGALTIQPGAAINVSTLGTPTASSYTILTYGSLVGTLPTITGVPSGYSVDTSTTGQVKLVTGSAFDSWINGFASLINPADKTMTADPDHDGLANVIEFVLNGDPTNSTITNLPTLTASGTNLVFTYTRRDDSESLAQAVEFDADIAGVWTTAVDGSNCTIAVTENGANPDTVTVTISKDANTKLFARLKVTP